MKQPFWILNSALLIIMLSALIFIFFAKIKLPRRQSIEPLDISIEQEPIEINLEEIYKNDLFKTYQPVMEPSIEEEKEEVLPQAPREVQPQVPQPPEIAFFDPLNITLTGIIVQEDDTKNVVIILDNKTQQQINYKVGDEIEDAQIVRILKDKVILIRSNGQQEILYTNKQDAKTDDPLQKQAIAKDAVEKVEIDSYIIDPKRFIKSVSNLSQALDLFDLSTAYKKGISIGVKVGKLEPNSIGYLIGLMPGDIIERIDNISTDTVDNRLNIYKNIISKSENDIIMVELLRSNMPLTITYKLKKIDRSRLKNIFGGIKTEFEKVEENRVEANKIKILHEKYQFGPTIEELRDREKQNMYKPKTILQK